MGRIEDRARALCSLLLVSSALAAPPAITSQPQSQTICDGDALVLTVVATGDALTYQWRKDDIELNGVVEATLTIDPARPTDSGVYDVVVTNAEGSATSDGAVVHVVIGPEILTDPSDTSACEGADVTFSVTLATGGSIEDVVGSAGSSGTGPRMRGNFYRVTTATTLTRIEHYLNITAAGPLVFYVYESTAAAGPYALILRDDIASAGPGTRFYSSNPLSLELAVDHYYLIGAAWPGSHTYYFQVGPTPPPHPKAVSFGTTLTQGGFQAGYADPLPDPPPLNTSSFAHYQRLTTSTAGLTYQWRKDDAPISGASGASLTLTAVTPTDAALYDVVVTDACGQTTSAAAALTIEPAPTITEQPADQSACVGEAVQFFVIAVGEGLTYQWRKNGVDLTGETADSLLIAAVASGDAGTYDVIATGCTDTASDAAVLTIVDAAPTIDADPASADVCEGAPLSLTVMATGADLGYQWRKDDVELPGETFAQLAIAEVATTDAGVYDVIVSNACGSTTSAGATVTVSAPIQIVTQPIGADLCAGDAISLVVAVTGDAPAYQWRRDGVDITGATDAELLIASAALGDAGDYDVVVTNTCGSVTSDVAVLRIADMPQITRPPRGLTVNAGEDVVLSVTATSSGTQASEAVGTATSNSTGPRMRANSYAATEDATLLRIAHELTITTVGDIRFFVYEADGAAGPWTLKVEDLVSGAGPGSGFFESGPLAFPLVAGKFYLIGAAWPGGHTYYWGGSHPQTMQFGATVAGRSLATSYQYPLPANPSNTSPLVHRQRLTTTKSDLTYTWRHDGVVIPGETAATLMLATVDCADAGNYAVDVTNPCGTVRSATAMVVIRGCPPFGNPSSPSGSGSAAGESGAAEDESGP